MAYYRVSFQSAKAKNSELTQEDYNSKYAEVKKDFGGQNDPKIVFNDGAKTVEADYIAEDFTVYQKPLMDALYGIAFPNSWGANVNAFESAFLTPEGQQRKTEILDDSRDGVRDLPYQEVPPETPEPDSTKSKLENLKDIVNSNPKGVCFGGRHGDDDRNTLMGELLDDPGHGGMSLFFIEELGVMDQPLIDEFLASAKGTPLAGPLKARVGQIKGMEAILSKMRDHNRDNPDDQLKAFGINSAEAKSRDGLMGLENRVAMMNNTAKEAIDRAIEANPGKKFMAFVGSAHSNTHPGGIPGLSQIFGVPAIKVEKGGGLKLDKEDKSLRGMPSREELAMIDKLAVKLEKDKAYAKLSQEDKHERLQNFIAQARKATFDSLDREEKKAKTSELMIKGVGLTDEEMAERIVIEAEDRVLEAYPLQDETITPEVKSSKHKELVKDLAKKLSQLAPEKKGNPRDLITKLSDAVAGGSALGFYKKDKAMKKGTAHVSIDTKSAKRVWLERLRRL